METENTSRWTAAPSHALLNTREAAAFLNLRPCTLEKWRSKGKGPKYTKLGSKAVRYRVCDLELFVQGGCENA